jgi:hypothetical protein
MRVGMQLSRRAQEAQAPAAAQGSDERPSSNAKEPSTQSRNAGRADSSPASRNHQARSIGRSITCRTPGWASCHAQDSGPDHTRGSRSTQHATRSTQRGGTSRAQACFRPVHQHTLSLKARTVQRLWKSACYSRCRAKRNGGKGSGRLATAGGSEAEGGMTHHRGNKKPIDSRLAAPDSASTCRQTVCTSHSPRRAR